MCQLVCDQKQYHYDGLVQERRNPSALLMECRFYCINPSIIYFIFFYEATHNDVEPFVWKSEWSNAIPWTTKR